MIVIKEGFANNNGVKIHYPADIVRAFDRLCCYTIGGMLMIEAHEIKRTLTEVVIDPAHAERTESPEFRKSKARLKRTGILNVIFAERRKLSRFITLQNIVLPPLLILKSSKSSVKNLIPMAMENCSGINP